ncbi:MAG: ABC transporter ATP-binding protein, partial [Armatimonadetes bacterium]|nr:ABC transporter ATP-binding protein [Armatimonadota bacterium]
MAGVRLVNLTKRFGNVIAVNGVSLEIRDGEFMVLVGPSGCGKTTCLRMIAGLEDPTEGEIWIGDRIVNDISPRDRNIAMVFQNYALYPHMTAYDNMAFALRLRRMPRHEIDRRVREAAAMLGISDLLDRRPRELSGGQRQRVALGRAIVREPSVFLMDEPLSNLDAKMRVETRAELIKLHRRLGITTIYVTHDQLEAMTMGDRIAVMRDGVIQQVDVPLGLFYNPANLFVAGFIGTPPMNFIEVRIKVVDDAVFVEGPGFSLRLPPEKAAAARPYDGKQVVFGIRPNDIYGSD